MQSLVFYQETEAEEVVRMSEFSQKGDFVFHDDPNDAEDEVEAHKSRKLSSARKKSLSSMTSSGSSGGLVRNTLTAK